MGDRVEINGHGPEASAGRLCPEKGLDRRASRLATYDNCVVSGNEQLLDRPIEIRNDARQRLEARDYCGLVSAFPFVAAGLEVGRGNAFDECLDILISRSCQSVINRGHELASGV